MSATDRGPAAGPPPLIPREVLFGNPTRTAPRISPDGTRIAWLAPHDGVLNVWVAPLGDEGPGDPRVITDDRHRGVRFYAWAHDGRHLVFLQDTGGDENWHLHSVDVTVGPSSTRDLTPFDGVQAQVVAHDRRRPTEMIVGLNRDDARLHDAYRLSLETGDLELLERNPGFAAWVADRDHVVRAALAPTPDGGMAVVGRTDEGWSPLMVAAYEDALTTQPVGFDGAGRRLLVLTSVDAPTARLVWIDAATGDRTEVVGDPSADVVDVWVDPETREPRAVAFERARRTWEVLDGAVAGDLDALVELDGGDVHILGADHADRRWVVATDHADGPVRFWVWDRDRRSAVPLFVHRPELEGLPLAPMEPFSFTARDGLEIHGYLTFPPGVPRRGLPAVLNVHGGPWARNSWGFDPEAQWLANRGYACIQVNFRGSTGYGKAFLNAGDRQWGAAMHDDLLDAVDHCVRAGWVDPARVAIYGGSYGGYAALVGAAFTPEVFRCAVDIVGPSNLETLIRSVPPYWTPMIAQFHRRVGDPDTDAELLWSRSPLSRVDNIRIPLLIAQGANDPRVKQAESEQIVAALRERGIPHRYLLFEDEGHGFARPENRLRFYAEAERFLAEHLGGRFEP